MSGQMPPSLLLTSPLGDDTQLVQPSTLHAIELHATERLSQPFEVRLTVVSTNRAIDPDELLFQPVCVTLRRKPQSDRFFNGVVRRIEAIGLPRRDRWTYQLDVVPRLWFLGQTADCRIFQQETAVDILQLLFSEHGISAVEFRIFGDRPTREYTTQYNETDLVFVHRLLQESGYFYFFEHTASAHRLVVTDRNQAFMPVDHPTHRVIHEGDNVDIFDRWHEATQTACGAVRLQDYDPMRPNNPVLGRDVTTLATAGGAARDVFRWPANTLENAVATDRARFCVQASEAEAGLREGHGFNSEFVPGRRFTLAKDPSTGAEGIEHVIHGVEHTATDDSWITGSAMPAYDNRFTCFLQSTPWREPLATLRPAMAGVFSAIVLGNAGEEIHADHVGRIKVRLLFDHREDTVAARGIWVRVTQPWSGKGWGWQHLPRVGTEVAVSFMNGDPDMPVVIGCFYHDAAQPPFAIPEKQTKLGLRSRSTPLGGSGEYSELSIDDHIGQELVYVRAQKDHTTEVLHDQKLTVDNSRTVRVTNEETVTIGNDYSLTTTFGSVNVTADTGKVEVTAALGITLRVLDNFISITPVGIEINGTLINLSALAAISQEAPLFNISGEAMVEIESPGVISMEAACILTEPFPIPIPV